MQHWRFFGRYKSEKSNALKIGDGRINLAISFDHFGMNLDIIMVIYNNGRVGLFLS